MRLEILDVIELIGFGEPSFSHVRCIRHLPIADKGDRLRRIGSAYLGLVSRRCFDFIVASFLRANVGVERVLRSAFGGLKPPKIAW